MTDQDASPPPNLRPQRAARLPNSPSRGADARDPSFLSTAGPPIADVEIHRQSARPNLANRNFAENRLSGVHRAHKHRSSGSFLLPDPVARHNSTRRRDPDPHTPERWQRRSFDQQTLADSQHGQEPVLGPASSSTQGPSGAPRPSGLPEEESSSTTITNRRSLAGDTMVGSSSGASTPQLDVESAQIVSMALNLSESRRLASRRNISQPTPPRLAPLPDNAHGGSLRYHLQQQRKISRTVSPKPDRSPRVGIGRVFTPLQPAFDPGTSYRYHFSTSTLARAQKAKEYLDLMAQYRRVLELVPQLEPEATARPWSATHPATPNSSGSVSRTTTNESEAKIGRPYNPLQYIRNRKVRARERRTIDGEEQGFTDVMKVSEWVDEVAKWVATGQARQPGNPNLPPFTTAQAAELQASPPPANVRAAAATKPKRPRVDWVIDPADMLADVHWLELDDNKRLVEDRHWRRVFPQGPEAPRPMSRDEAARLTTPGSAKVSLEAHTPGEKATPEPPAKHDHEHVLMAARDRAQQKFRALKGSHHRHTSSFTNRDLLRLHRGSASESSDTDSDRRRRAKSGIPPNTVRSVLEKQMEEMIAREQLEAESHPLYDHEAKRMKFAPMTPDRDPSASGHHPADSRAELSDTETKGAGLRPHPLVRSPPSHAGRASLEVPTSRRFSVDDDTSQPNSPNLRPTPEVGLVPALGMDLSPMSSRAGSPHRNPLTRVKGIFRERSKERNTDAHHLGEDGGTLNPQDHWTGTPEPTGSGVSSPQRRPSRSPIGERILGHRSHKSLSSAKLRGEDGGISFRSLLRGPRIDTVLRSGVSKVSDMIWRKDGDDSSGTSSDDSEVEARGRSRGPRHGRSRSAQDVKTLLDAPLLQNYESTSQTQLQHPSVRPISRRSSRFDLLKPPRIDVQNASPSTSPPPVQVRNQAPVGSDTESQAGPDDTRAASIRLDAALALPHRSTIPANRQWSIADRSIASGSTAVSKREIARLRTLLLSSGIHAMEMDRRAKARKLLPSPAIAPTTTTTTATATDPSSSLTWPEIARLAPDAATEQRLLTTPLAQVEAYPIAARTLAASTQASTSHLHTLSSRFVSDTAPALLRRVESLRGKVAHELTDLAQSAIDAADEANHDLVVGQRLKVKHVLDAMDKMLRRRRRRFRWIRRVGWLVVEWVLVGCMWYVWFLVMIARVGLGVGKGAVRGVKWLLWL